MAPLVRPRQWGMFTDEPAAAGRVLFAANWGASLRQLTTNQAFLDFIRERDPLQAAGFAGWPAVQALEKWIPRI